MSFTPQVNHSLTIDRVNYRFTEHPAAPGLPYGQRGKRAEVYQLVAPDGSLHAFKVFVAAFRTPRIAENTLGLRRFAHLPGLEACIRTVLTPQSHTALIDRHHDLAYAVLMPWVRGETWFDIVGARQQMTAEHSRMIAGALAHVLASMEVNGVAHCDLSGPNTLVRLDEAPISVALVDVEDMHGPGLVRPEKAPGGSPGYAHRQVRSGAWSSMADRFAGAILLAEMLGWCDARIRASASDESYFDADEIQQPSSARLDTLVKVLYEHYGATITRAFNRAWYSERLDECPEMSEWADALGMPAQVTGVPAAPARSRPVAAATPPAAPGAGPVKGWRALGDLGDASSAPPDTQALAGPPGAAPPAAGQPGGQGPSTPQRRSGRPAAGLLLAGIALLLLFGLLVLMTR